MCILIAQHAEGRLGEVIRDLKSYSAREIIRSLDEPGESRRDWIKNLFRKYADGKKQNKEYSVWQKTQHPVELSWPEIYDQKVEYIIMNPVSCGLVSDEAAWKYGSMGSYSPLRLTAGGTIETVRLSRGLKESGLVGGIIESLGWSRATVKGAGRLSGLGWLSQSPGWSSGDWIEE
jgi:hypothetical protein